MQHPFVKKKKKKGAILAESDLILRIIASDVAAVLLMWFICRDIDFRHEGGVRTSALSGSAAIRLLPVTCTHGLRIMYYSYNDRSCFPKTKLCHAVNEMKRRVMHSNYYITCQIQAVHGLVSCMGA